MTETNPSSVLCHTIPASETGVCAFDDPEGLSRTPILSLAQDERGYLWIGTERGPVRFDGMAWETPSSLAELGSFETWAFDTTEPNCLWVGTNGAGLWLMDTQPTPYRRLTALTPMDGLADADVHVLCRDVAGALWVGTHHGLAIVEEGRVTTRWTAGDAIPEAGICALCADRAGGMWAGSLHGLLWLDRHQGPTRLTCDDGLPDSTVYALCLDAADRVWVGTRRGIAILQGGRVQVTLLEGLPSPEVRALCRDHAGRMWAGTAAGLALIEHGRIVTCWTRQQHLPSSSVWSLLCDCENRLWVGTEGGIALLPQQSMPAHALSLGATREGAYSFTTDHHQRTWIGGPAGLVTVEPDARTITTLSTLPPILAHAGAWATHCDDAGRIWVGGRYGGLFCLDPTTGVTLDHLEGINSVRCVVDDPEGRRWLGTLGAGVACLDIERATILHRLAIAQGMPCDHISSLCLDECERLWVATLGGGLVCVDRRKGAVTKTLGLADGLPHLAVSGLVRGRANELWGTTQGGGLFRVDLATDRIVGVWTVADGLPSDTLLSCALDANDSLWLGTARGLARFQPGQGTGLALGRPHGLPGESCQQGALMLDDQGRLWVGTTEGVAVVAPRDVPRTIPASAVLLTGLRIMGHERAIVDGMEIEDSDYDMVVDYGAVTFVAAAQVLYRTQLVGLESEWSRPHHNRFARYTNLRPGDYTFRVAARNWGGQWSEPAEWRFRVVRDRRSQELDQAQQRAEAAEAAVRVRNEVLSAVAHDLRAPLTAIMGQADLLRSRLERTEAPNQDWLRQRAGSLHDGARRMASMVDDIMDAVQLQMGRELALQVAPVDLGALTKGVIRALDTGDGQEPVLELDSSRDLTVDGDQTHLERVVQNLIGNAIKYSPAGSPVRVAVRREADAVTIRVVDYGVGIPADELPHLFTPYYRASTAHGKPGTGLGLAGARSIVQQHDGRITLDSHVDRGTTVTIYLPCRTRETP